MIFFILPVYMTLLMTAWCKSKFTMLCKHVIVYCGDKKTSLDELSKHQQMDTRTIENMRLSLLILLSNIKCSAKIVM
jgi:hypothetical protein